MKIRIANVLIVLIFTAKITIGKNISDTEKNKHFYILCKTWGALKYFNESDKKDVDSIFITAYMQLDDYEDINIVINNVIGSFNEIKDKKIIKTNLIPAWVLNDSILNTSNKEKLSQLFLSYNGGKNPYYYDRKSTKPNFKNEKNYYKEGIYPSPPLRFLGLARLFNIYYYFYPYKNQIKTPLDDLLMEYIPLVIKATDAVDYHESIYKFIANVEDSHNFIFSAAFVQEWKWAGFYPSLHITKTDSIFTIKDILSDSLLNNNIIGIGDTILKIDNNDVFEEYNRLNKLFGNSNSAAQDYKICTYYLLNGSLNSVLNLSLKKDGLTKNITLKRDIGFGKNYFKNLSSIPFKINQDTLYINARTYTNKLFKNKAFKNAFYSSNVLILDMRGYPESDDVFKLMSILTTKKTEAAKYNWVYNKNILLTKSSMQIIKPQIFRKTPSFKHLDGIIDVSAISAMETLAMCYRAIGGNLMGSPTIAGNGNLRNINVPGIIFINMSILSVNFPDGTSLLPDGVVPDKIDKYDY